MYISLHYSASPILAAMASVLATVVFRFPVAGILVHVVLYPRHTDIKAPLISLAFWQCFFIRISLLDSL